MYAHQLLGADGENQLLSLLGREAIAIDLPGKDLPIDDRRQMNVDDRLLAHGVRPLWLQLAERKLPGKIVRVERLMHDFRQSADLKDQGI